MSVDLSVCVYMPVPVRVACGWEGGEGGAERERGRKSECVFESEMEGEKGRDRARMRGEGSEGG